MTYGPSPANFWPQEDGEYAVGEGEEEMELHEIFQRDAVPVQQARRAVASM